jgi:hypothetical protein
MGKMKTLLSFSLLALALMCSITLKAYAQENQIQITQDKHDKVKIKGERVVLRDKSKPVRRALEEQYAKIAEAQKNKDIEALRQLRTSDFTVKMPNGETWSLEQSLNYSKRGFEQVQSMISMSNTIESLTVNENEAVAVVHQQWSRMQMMKDKLRRVDTSAVQRETWVNTPEGWRLKLIDEIHPGAWVVDGKRVDPSKPYDPDAPPYNPDNTAPKK